MESKGTKTDVEGSDSLVPRLSYFFLFFHVKINVEKNQKYGKTWIEGYKVVSESQSKKMINRQYEHVLC